MRSKMARAANRNKHRPEPHPDPNVRAARIEGHEVFDMLWQEGTWTRSHAYRWLSEQFGYDFHFGEADGDECERAQAICQDKLEDLGLL